VLRVRATVPDSSDPSKPFKLEGRFPLPKNVDDMTQAQLDEFIGSKVRHVLLHEHDEHFRRSGKPVNDPHKEQA
jgi:hypothetical protein